MAYPNGGIWSASGTHSHAAGRALFPGELHPPADHFGGMQPDDGPGRLAVRPGRLRHGLGRAADQHAPGPPWWQHVIDHEGDIRVVLRVAELPAPGEVPAADVDHVQPGVIAPAEGNDVRHPGSVDGREPAEPALGQVGQLGIREHAHLALTPPAAIVKAQWTRRYTRRPRSQSPRPGRD